MNAPRLMDLCRWCDGTGHRDEFAGERCSHCDGDGMICLNDEVWDADDDGQPDEIQEWADYDPDC